LLLHQLSVVSLEFSFAISGSTPELKKKRKAVVFSSRLMVFSMMMMMMINPVPTSSCTLDIEQ